MGLEAIPSLISNLKTFFYSIIGDLISFIFSFYYQYYCKSIIDKSCCSSGTIHILSPIQVLKKTCLSCSVLLIHPFEICGSAVKLQRFSAFLQINAYCILLRQHQQTEVVLFQRIYNPAIGDITNAEQNTFLFTNKAIMSATILLDLVNKYFVRIHQKQCCKVTFCC